MHTTHAQSVRLVLSLFLTIQFSPPTITAASAQVLAGKPAPQQASINTALAQGKFESSLASAAITQPFLFAPLSWSAYPGASSYRVLRGQSASTAAVTVTSLIQTQYTARVLPGNTFVFRVVAFAANGKALDTTKAVALATPGVAQASLVASCTRNNGTLTLGWNAIANADDYSVVIQHPNKRPPHGNMPPPDTVVNTIVTTTSYSTSLPTLSDGYFIVISANSALHDYPTAGKTTRASVAMAGFNDVIPSGTPGPCQGQAPK